MRKLAISLALATTALATTAIATPAAARDGAFYVGAEGGPMIVEDMDYRINGFDRAATINTDYGYDFGGYVGYDFGAFRLEAEASYRSADVQSGVFSSQGLPGNGATPQNGTYRMSGDASALAFMVNGMLDFGPEDGLQGYVGGGAGVARVKLTNVYATPRYIDDSDTRFAWQAIAGIRAPISSNMDVGLRYRFFNVNNVSLRDVLGRTTQTRFRSHSLLGTFTYNFGAPVVAPVEVPVEAPPPPPPAPVTPPPPPPPPQVTCNTGPYIVFFDWDKSDIRPDAATVLDNAITQYGNCGTARIMLAGYTDTSGTAQYNLGLSQRRNDSVRAYLTSHGVSDGVISSQAFGETNLRVPTADGVREPQNRRVEITYGPGSGY